MISSAAVIAEALEWVETPFHWHQSLKGVGCDCRGLIIGVAHALQLTDWDCLEYSQNPDPDFFRERIEEICSPAPHPTPGTLLFLRYGRYGRHCGLRGVDCLIHAYPPVNKVCSHSIAKWERAGRVMGEYYLPGVDYANP